jgi:hypothetical protein
VEDQQRDGFSVDDQLASYLDKQSQRYSRRGFLGRASSLMLRLCGLALLPLLPFDRRANAQGGACDWSTCNMCGNFCQAAGCCDQTAHFSSCPNCLVQKGAWSGCCTDSCGANHSVTYTDCGSTNATTAAACKSSVRCTGGCPGEGIFWNGTGFVYSCTFLTILGDGTC